MTGNELLPLIRATGRGDRYSENLMKWVKKYRNWPIYAAFSRHSNIDGSEVEYDASITQAYHVIICIGGDDGFATGSRLSQILGKGAKADRFVFPVKSFKVIDLPDWWQGYIDGGKCFIDPQHVLYQDAERWKEGKKTRECLWCGNYRQEKVKKTKVYYIWQ